MSLNLWRDISVILLVIEFLIIGLVYGAIFYFIWKGLRLATRWLRGTGLPQGQRYSRRANQVSLQYSQKIVRPVVNLEGKLHQVSRTLDAVATTSKQRSRRY